MMFVANVLALLVMPFVLNGVINRTKSLWSGRKGPPIFQLLFDVLRLARKTPVYSSTTTAIFYLGPYVFLMSAVGSAVLIPLLGASPIASFRFDFVWFAYVWGLGRVALMLAALDTGSAFEGMGASREALFSSLIEPALFLVIGTLSFLSGSNTLAETLAFHVTGAPHVVAWLAAIVALVVVLQVEVSRMPVDDPSTHLELTMVHEVMVLDHCGTDLAAVQAASAIKLFVCAAAIATLVNPWSGSATIVCAATNLACTVVIAVIVATVESLTARLKLQTVPQYIVIAFVAGAVALLAAVWQGGVS
jgi:formate hydrogenlyase subunit 4